MVELVYSAVYVRLLFAYRELDRASAEQVIETAMAGIGAPTAVSRSQTASRA